MVSKGALMTDSGRRVVYCDGSVRKGDWSASCWFLDEKYWGVNVRRGSNSFLAELTAVSMALEGLDGKLLVRTDCGSLVRVLCVPAGPNRRKPGRMGHRRSERLVEMAELRSVLADRDVEFEIVAGHNSSTPVEHRVADLLCRYGIIRMAGEGGSTLVLEASDLAGELSRAGVRPPVDKFGRAVADKLKNIGIFDERRSDGRGSLDWRSGGFDLAVFGSVAPGAIRAAELEINRARRSGDTARAVRARERMAGLWLPGASDVAG
jgi:hypothetical protein